MAHLTGEVDIKLSNNRLVGVVLSIKLVPNMFFLFLFFFFNPCFLFRVLVTVIYQRIQCFQERCDHKTSNLTLSYVSYDNDQMREENEFTSKPSFM